MPLYRTLVRGTLAGGVMLAAVLSSAFACSGTSFGPGGQDAGVDSRRDAGAPSSHEGGRDARPRPDDGPPSLMSLVVLAGETGARMVPSFSPGTYDYYVTCAAGTNELTVRVEAAGGATASISLESPGGSFAAARPAMPEQSATLAVEESQAVVVTAALGSAREQYWVRCLPSDFPEMKWVRHADTVTPTPGYYLVGVMYLVAGVHPYAMILDGNGVPVWFRFNPTFIHDVDSLSPGTVSYADPWQIHELRSSKTSYVTAEGKNPNDHELRVLANGNYLVIWEELESANLTGLEIPYDDGGLRVYGPDAGIVDCDVLEVEPSGDVVWKWVASDHFDPVASMTYKAPGMATNYVDAFHCNSLDVDPATGNILVSSRHMDSVFYVDRQTSRVLWKLGGTAASKDDASYVATSDPFYRQHDARLQPGWVEDCDRAHGRLSVFDDQTGEVGPARAAVYDVDVEMGDGGSPRDCGSEAGGAGDSGAKLVWQRKGEAVSESTGSFRIDPDGSRLIAWGQALAPAVGQVFTEVDDQGRAQIDLEWPQGCSSYRAIKVPLSAFDLDVLRRSAGQ
jgi:hypothetical protein